MVTKKLVAKAQPPFTVSESSGVHLVSQRFVTENGGVTDIKIKHLCSIPAMWHGDPSIRRQDADRIAAAMNAHEGQLVPLVIALLDKIDSITSDDFAHGAERPEREAVRKLLVNMGAL